LPSGRHGTASNVEHYPPRLSAPSDVRLRVLYVGVCGIDVIESVGKESHGA